MNTTNVAKRFGVNISTIKRWTDEGKLACSRTPGGHRRFEEKHIRNFIKRFPQFGKSVNNSEKIYASYLDFKNVSMSPLLQYELKSHAIAGNTGWISRLFRFIHKNDVSLAEFFEQLLIPVLRRLGDEWLSNIITIGQEHVATSSIKNAVNELGDQVKEPDQPRPILFSTLKDDHHDMISTILSFLARLEGYPVIFTGADTPAESLHYYIRSYEPKMIFLSYQYGTDQSLLMSELDVIGSFTAGTDISVYLGGLGAKGLDSSSKITILETMYSGYSILKEQKL